MGNDWTESTEGDLDPDLTEEAGYAGWDAPSRSWLRPLLQGLAALTLLAFLGGVMLTALGR